MGLDRDTTFTWYGHACVEVRTPGDKVILIDRGSATRGALAPPTRSSAATCCW